MDAEGLRRVADRLAGLPGVEAVALGGSRAAGTAGPGSDWDLGVYYRGVFDPGALRGLGWPGEVSEVGGWGGGLFNGGAWLAIDGDRVDVHYRDLAVVDRVVMDAEAGRYRVEPLAFHLAGIPSYLLLAELAANRTLVGELLRVPYPPALRTAAAEGWWGAARGSLDYARSAHAVRGATTACVGLLALGAAQAAHAVLAARAVWVTNEKRLLALAGLESVDEDLRCAGGSAVDLVRTADAVRRRCEEAVRAAQG